jgi:cobalt-zinc-cadmium efflux system membrane fusion protein
MRGLALMCWQAPTCSTSPIPTVCRSTLLCCPPMRAGFVWAIPRSSSWLDGETRIATVHSITPALDAQSKTATLILTPQGAAQLTAGQGVRVRVRPGGQPSDGRMTLPEEAVQTVEGKNMVFVRGPKGFQATEVVIGERSGGRIEIISGIPAGTVVATKGAFLLKAELGKGEAEH